jgi:tetratricopeptide (TPR) repeat protein
MSNVLPAGNICPSGKIGRVGPAQPRTSTRSDVLGSGTGNYGHGSIMWGGCVPAASSNFQEATKRGNEYYKKGLFLDALRWYDKAVSVSPENASCKSNRAAALIGLGRIGEALRECEEAVRLDPTNEKAQHRLAMLNLR